MSRALHVLIVDDEKAIRTGLKFALEEEGYEVSTATDGRQALDVFRKAPVPIVFTDIYMPNMTGIELLENLKQHHGDTQVIMMTDYASTDSAIATLRAGAYDYIMKPFEDIDVVCNTARRAAQKVRLQQETYRLFEMLKKKTASLEAANADLKALATHDALTGLYNHRHFQESLLKEIHRSERYNKSFSLLFIDLDYFKAYNDTNGHLQGDRLLKNLAHIFLASFRRTDIVARYGGDEFVVILPETSGSVADILTAKLHQQVKSHLFVGMKSMPGGRITVSIGSATYPEHGTDANALIQYADMEMYMAKKKKQLLVENAI